MSYLRRTAGTARASARPRVKYETTGGVGGIGDEAAPDQVELLTQIRDSAKTYVAQDKTMRILQIGATLAIPLAAAVWRVILHKRSGTPLL